MPHRPSIIRIALLVGQPEPRFGGGLIVNPQTPPNAADNKGDGFLAIGVGDALLIVDN